MEICTSGDFILYPEYYLRFATCSKCILSFFRSYSVLRLLSLGIFLLPKRSRCFPRATQLTYNSVAINAFSILYRPTLKGLTTTSIITNFSIFDSSFVHQGATCLHILRLDHSVKIGQLPRKALWLWACTDVIKRLLNQHPSHLVNLGQLPRRLSTPIGLPHSFLTLSHIIIYNPSIPMRAGRIQLFNLSCPTRVLTYGLWHCRIAGDMSRFSFC